MILIIIVTGTIKQYKLRTAGDVFWNNRWTRLVSESQCFSTVFEESLSNEMLTLKKS